MSAVFWHPLAWWAAAFTAYALAVNSAWLYEHRRGLELPPLAVGSARLLYMVGVPAIVVWQRVAQPAHFGLRVPEPMSVAGVGTMLAIVMVIALLATVAASLGESPQPRMQAARPGATQIAGDLLEAVQLEAHWAFARAAALAVGIPRLGTFDERNLAATLALAMCLLLLEALASPTRRTALLDQPWRLPSVARRATLCVLSMLVFAISLSSIAALAAHALARVGLRVYSVDIDGDTLPLEQRTPVDFQHTIVEPTVI